MTPPYRPEGIDTPKCRYPRCDTPVFFDRRVQELREWCSDQHMMSAIRDQVEAPCKHCQVWPRRKGHKYCSGKACGFPY